MRPVSLFEVARYRSEHPHYPLWKPLCEFLDEFYASDRDQLSAMLSQEPDAALEAWERAYLAASAEYLSAGYRLPQPTWPCQLVYFLKEAWWPEEAGPAARALYLAESPTSFRRRLIYTERWPLCRKAGPVLKA